MRMILMLGAVALLLGACTTTFYTETDDEIAFTSALAESGKRQRNSIAISMRLASRSF